MLYCDAVYVLAGQVVEEIFWFLNGHDLTDDMFQSSHQSCHPQLTCVRLIHEPFTELHG